MVQPDTYSHVDHEEEPEATNGLEVAGVEGVVDGKKTDEKEDAGRSPHRSLVNNRNVKALDSFAEAWVLG